MKTASSEPAGDPETPTGTDDGVGGYDDDEAPPIPRIIAWEDLTAVEYQDAITELDAWVRQFVDIYRLGATYITPCWFNHRDMVHTLSHLHTGWLLTRHPQAGTGLLGLEWDRWREVTLPWLRSMTNATSGCATGQHKTPSTIPWLAEAKHRDNLAIHITAETSTRSAAELAQATAAAAEIVLRQAEDRAPTAASVLDEVCPPPAEPTQADIDITAERLRAELKAAAQRAASAATAAAGAHLNRDHRHRAARDLDNRRTELATAITEDADPTEWANAVELAEPAQHLVAAAALRRTNLAAGDQEARDIARRSRHPNLNVLFGGVAQDPTT